MPPLADKVKKLSRLQACLHLGRFTKRLGSLVLISGIGAACALHADDPDELAAGFAHPPDSAKPYTWWHWMNGNVTKAGITADLEAMKRIGVGGAQIFNVDLGIPAGPVKFMSPEWLEMIRHATQEAGRLGLELGIQNCAGWSTGGGPWITPENAMQSVTTSEVRVNGPKAFSGVLPQPPSKLKFYRDIAVFAFRTPEGENADVKSLSPKVTASIANANGGCLLDGDAKTSVMLPKPQPGRPQFVQLEFSQPFTARSIVLAFVPGTRACGGVLQVSDDGQSFRDLRTFTLPERATAPLTLTLGDAPVRARFYRAVFNTADMWTKSIAVTEFQPSPRLRIEGFEYKSVSGVVSVSSSAVGDSAAAPLVVRRDDLVDLSARLKPDGRLDWDVPAGDWTILRLGYTPTGKNNHPAPPEATGPEVDKLSREALDTHWAGIVKPVLDAAGLMAGKSLNNILVDSYEAENQNWTPKFREEFQKRRGYDPLPFLPALTGRVVDSPAVSERFLWDFRRTISDLFAENFFGHFQALCHQAGLTISVEPYGGPFDPLEAGALADIPMGEFWAGIERLHDSPKLAATIGHIYGRKVIASESFTAAPGKQGRWQDDPYSLKTLGDLVFCQGVNRLTFHRYAMQPWTEPARVPGMTMGPWGMHFDRTNTWWDQGTAWLKYLTRCQYLLQQGRFVADAAYFHNESAPSAMNGGNPELPTRAIYPGLPAGYDYDGVNTLVLKTAVIENGELVLKSGMRYRVLILSASNRAMTPELLGLLRGFVAAGLTLIGPPPSASPSLSGYPGCDAEVKKLAAEMWGDCDGKTVTEHRFGEGRVVWGQTMAQVFATLDLKPDFEYATDQGSQLAFIHRLDGNADIYFVSNQRERFDTLDCAFRVSGKIPELWNAETGCIENAPVWREENGRTILPLSFDPAGSIFVVFRNKTSGDGHLVSAKYATSDGSDGPLPKPVILTAIYESVDDGRGWDVRAALTPLLSERILKITVDCKTFGGDPAPLHYKQLRLEYSYHGRVTKMIVPENQTLEIDCSTARNEPPVFGMSAGPDGKLMLRTSSPGVAELKTASGQTRKIEVTRVPKPVEASGPWTLNFPSNWGAPARITLPQLISWTEYPDSGVKYFSGTATYVKEVSIPEETFGKGNALWLNLGEVKNFAEVSINGKPLGILWKPPFRVDITGAAKPGKNTLEIRVTNLWPNRLIGDEQLPPDCEWTNAGSLKKWPQWLLEGKPSPTGRLTFTTWHLWKKDDVLLPSGLLGPVTISPEITMAVN